MSQATPRHPKTSYLLTRRVAERHLRLIERSGRKVEDLFRYAIGKAQAAHGVAVHAVCVMGNHWHAVVTDVEANIPDFARDVHSLVGRAINAEDEASDGLWDRRGTSYVAIESEEDVWRYLVYTVTNPVQALLVKSHAEYPGLVTRPGQTVRTMDARRPRLRFFKRSRLKRIERLSLSIPPALAHLTPVEFRNELGFRVRVEEALLQERAKAEGKTFLGRRAILRMRRDQPPRTRERGGRLRPTLAESNRTRRIERLTALKLFRQQYAVARALWLQGLEAVFPAGTFQLRGYPGVVVADTS